MNTVIRNGVIIDPVNGRNRDMDIYIEGNTIVKIGQDGQCSFDEKEFEVLDVCGSYVSAGLIDLHTHVFEDDEALGLRADRIGVEQGVTTVIDAGSAGTLHFNDFRKKTIDNSLTRVLAFLNISELGIPPTGGELKDLNNININNLKELIKECPLIRGIKVRMSRSILGNSNLRPLLIARDTARQLGIPMMVHIGNGPPDLGCIYDLLDDGDVITHAFHGKVGGLFGSDGNIILPAASALKRGVLLDVGHGESSFDFGVMKKARELGVEPYTISTDLHRMNVDGPVYSLLTTMSKFLALEYSLSDVIDMTTRRPAIVLGMVDSLGNLDIGKCADLSIFKRELGQFDFYDAENSHIVGSQLLKPQYSIRAGVVLKCKE